MQMTKMEHKGFFARIKEAERLIGDTVHGLPPGRDLPVYYADAFNVYPENWMKGPGVFVVPVRPNKGLWFDWRDNDENNTAIIPTVKGCNPITGLQTTGFFLERYDSKCPKHGCDFQANRFCPECGYKWPDRNYVSQSPLWWDGFASEGDVRQFFFTEEMMRDIATHMIGKENTVSAFGFAFYSPKEPRPKAEVRHIYNTTIVDAYPLKSMLPTANHVYYSSACGHEVKGKGLFGSSLKKTTRGMSTKLSAGLSEQSYSYSPPSASFSGGGSGVEMDALFNAERGVSLNYVSPVTDGNMDSIQAETPIKSRESYTPQKEVAVGAGAKIRQVLPTDTYGLDTWKDKPDSVMTIYFVFQEEFERMAAGGMKDFSDCKDGMLKGLPVG